MDSDDVNWVISVDSSETATGIPLVFGPYEDRDVAVSDWHSMGSPYFGVFRLRKPPAVMPRGTDVMPDKDDDEDLQTSFAVLVHEAEEGGYWSEVVGLPGAGSQGETLNETIKQTRASIRAVVLASRDGGDDYRPLKKSDRWVTLKFRDLT